jgi:predicted CXXCH cytochrome family protein
MRNATGYGLLRGESRAARGLRSRALTHPWRLLTVLAVAALLPIGLALAAVSTAPVGQRDWYWQNPLPQGNALGAVVTVGASDAWAVGGPGVVLHTSDRGAVWESQDPGTAQTLNAVAFADPSTGWVVGDGGTIRATVDRGSSWTTQTAGTSADLHGVAVSADGSRGWVVGDAGTILGTSDGGATWVPQTSSTSERLTAVSTVGDGRVWAVGDNGTMKRTVDGGATWTDVTVPGAARLNGVTFVDALTGWVSGEAVGGAAFLRKTTDGGLTWAVQAVPTTRSLYGVTFVSATTGWVVGDGGTILRTSDGGDTWTDQSTGTLDLRDAAMWGAGDAVAVGLNGRMLRTADSGTTWGGPTPATTSSIGGIAFSDAYTGVAAAAGGALAFTGDGGGSWQPVASASVDLHGVDAAGAGGGFWAVGDGGTIVRSADGTNWAAQSSGVSTTLRHVDAVDPTHAWAVGDGATILGTTDGSTWTAQDSHVATSVDFNGASFPDDQYGWVVGGAVGASGTVAHTIDGGSTWATQTIDAGDTILRAASFVDRNNGWVVGDGGLVEHTTDGGTTWTAQDAGVAGPLFAVAFSDTLNGWVAGGTGGSIAQVRHTTDGGVTWTSVPPGTGHVIRALAFVDAQRGWAAGDGGTILRTTDPGAPSTVETVSPAVSDGDNGWYVTTPTVTLRASKPGLTLYRLGTSGPLQTWSSPFEISGEGTAALEYYSVDTADVRETTRTVEIRVDRSKPTTPTGLAAAPTSSTVAAASWDAASDAVSGVHHYRITLDGAVLGNASGTALSVTDLSPETTYVVGVSAVDHAGNTSGETTTMVQTNAILPRPPAGVHARLAPRNTVYVNWTEPTATVGPVTYSVWRSMNGAAYQRVGTTIGILARSFVDTTVPDPVTLEYGVSVTDGRGTGSISAAGSIFDSVLTSGPPAPPRLRAIATTQGVETSWTPPATVSPVTYALLRATSPTSAPTTVSPAGLGGTSWRDEAVVPHTEYWYRILSVDAFGDAGPMSEPVRVRAETTGPPGPHANFKKQDDSCALCHSAHAALQENLLRIPGDSELPLCYSCHDGTSASDVLGEFSDSHRLSRHDVTAGPMPGGLSCTSCHDPHGAGGSEATGSLLSVQGVRGGNAVCYGCHTATSTPVPFGDLRMFEGSGHASGVPDPPDGSRVKCLACHGGHSDSMDAGTLFAPDDRCLRCHSTDGSYPGAADIKAALSGPGPDTRHDLLASDQEATGARLACNNCHEPHSSSITTPLVDPRNPSTTGGWTGSSAEFCLRCHGLTLPASSETTPWVSAPLASAGATATSNIASGWAGSFHGDGVSVSPVLRLDMGWKSGDVLTCLDCHDAHGSVNRWTLKTSVQSRTGTGTVDGLLAVPVGSGADLRFFCSGCHDLTAASHPGADAGGADLSLFPIDCTAAGCHTHRGTGL